MTAGFGLCATGEILGGAIPRLRRCTRRGRRSAASLPYAPFLGIGGETGNEDRKRVESVVFIWKFNDIAAAEMERREIGQKRKLRAVPGAR